LVPVCPELVAGVKFFGRYRSGAASPHGQGPIRDGALLTVS
jgi:hypothetical protein